MAKDVSSGENKVDDKKPVKKREKNVVSTKLVIRRLPPSLTQEELLEIIAPLPPHDYFRYVHGDRTLAPENYCRAYINLQSSDDILAFRDKVDGLEFTDSRGNCQPCVLEYAPFQKNPRKNKKKEDSKVGTIEEDADYKTFLESLEAEDDKTVLDLEKYLDELEKKEQKNKFVETPLTAFLKQKREERKRIRDERRRVEQERRKKRDEERRRRDAERKKKLDAEKSRKKKEDEKKHSLKKVEGKKDSLNQDDQVEDSKSDKSETQGKGDAKQLHKGKFESERPKTGPRLNDTKPRKSENREPLRRGPIGSKPKDQTAENGEKERSKDGYSDRSYSGKDGYDRGYSGGRGSSRGRGYRPPSSRDFTSRKWDKGEDPPPRARGKLSSEEQEKKVEKNKPKRPDREIYKPGSGRGSRPLNSSEDTPRSHKYSERRSKSKQDEDK